MEGQAIGVMAGAHMVQWAHHQSVWGRHSHVWKALVAQVVDEDVSREGEQVATAGGAVTSRTPRLTAPSCAARSAATTAPSTRSSTTTRAGCACSPTTCCATPTR
jgi:hypothetical protein